MNRRAFLLGAAALPVVSPGVVAAHGIGPERITSITLTADAPGVSALWSVKSSGEVIADINAAMTKMMATRPVSYPAQLRAPAWALDL